jgi:transcriptional regulator with PAS, ATPase and Fis domain
MRRVYEKAGRVALQDTTLLITGDTGVGKERLARWVHAHSRRRDRRFVAVNCAAFPEALLDTHLFGHTRGAFTGAVQDAAGIFEAAAAGTLFLDEIGDVSSAMQVKLLRVIQEREVHRIGEWRARPIDVRLIAATNRNLSRDIEEGRFRADLFYRLRVAALDVPPLRARPEDLRVLARELLTRTAARLDREAMSYSPEAFARLMAYEWPGNVRELENAIEEACTLAAGPAIQIEDLPESIRRIPTPAPRSAVEGSHGRRPLERMERLYIEAVLQRHGGNRCRAAEELQISLSTLKRKLARTDPRRQR